MRVKSAIIFATTGCLGGLFGELWRLHQGGRPADLGVGGSVIGLVLFGGLFAVMIYIYSGLAQMSRSEGRLTAYEFSAMLGFPFWFVLLPLHNLLRDRFAFPDIFLLVESALLCAASFEIIRWLSKLRTKA